ncbi:MAG TPA: hypothetical protein VFZ32_17180 [Micromonosporaceae bacterium]
MDTAVGPTHVDAYGQLTGWLCPIPHMTLATPAAAELATTPAWVEALQATPPRYARTR